MGRPVPGHHQPAGAGRQGAARHGAEVVRVGDLVEHHEHVGVEQSLGVGVAGSRRPAAPRPGARACPSSSSSWCAPHRVHRQVLGDEAGDGVEGRRGRGEPVGSPPRAGPQRDPHHVPAVQPLHRVTRSRVRRYTPSMPIDVSPGSFAAVAISTLFWWTVLSPAALLAVAVLCGRRPRLRGALTLVVLVPPRGDAAAGGRDARRRWRPWPPAWRRPCCSPPGARDPRRWRACARTRARRPRRHRGAPDRGRRRHGGVVRARGGAALQLSRPYFLTTWVPCGVSRTSNPAAWSSSRSRSASAHCFSAR